MFRALVVEDDFVSRKLITEIIKHKLNYDVAVNGREAVAAVAAAVENGEPYDLIFMDIAMPEMDGIQALKLIREDEEARGVVLGHGVPVIMVTAYDEPFLDAFNSGCDDYIVKPIDVASLMRKVEEKLGSLE